MHRLKSYAKSLPAFCLFKMKIDCLLKCLRKCQNGVLHCVVFICIAKLKSRAAVQAKADHDLPVNLAKNENRHCHSYYFSYGCCFPFFTILALCLSRSPSLLVMELQRVQLVQCVFTSSTENETKCNYAIRIAILCVCVFVCFFLHFMQ